MKMLLSSVSKIILLLMMFCFCSGFSWGVGKPAPCTDAMNTLATLSRVTDIKKREKLENEISKKCPDGPAGLFVKARQLERSSKTDEAIALYRQALQRDDSFAEGHGDLGLLLFERGMQGEAVVELTKGLMGHEDPRYHRALAGIIGTSDLHSLALFHYDEALKAYPDDTALRAGRAQAYAELNQLDMAEEEYLQLKVKHPTDPRFRLGLADVYRKSGKLDKAIKELQAYVKAFPADRDGHRLYAELLMEKGDRESARGEFLLAGVDVTIDPEDYVRKGDAFMMSREYGPAIGAYQTALKGRGDWPETQYKLTKALMAAGRDDEALAHLTRLVSSGFEKGTALQDLGFLHERSGQLDEAIQAYQRALSKDPDNVNVHRRLAEILTWRGKFLEAAAQYRELVRLRNDNPLYHLNLGRLYDRIKERKRAIQEYETAIKLDPNSVEGYRELARIFILEKQPTKAEQYYKEVIRINNDDEAARNGLIALYVKQRRLDELAAFVKNWLEQSPDDPQRHYRLGIVYEAKKEYELAVAEYGEALKIIPDNARFLYALGRTYLKTGKLSEARDMLEASKKADPTFAEPQALLSSISFKSQEGKKNTSFKKKTRRSKGPVRKAKHSVHKKPK